MTFSCENEIVFLHCYDYKRVFGFQTLEAKINIDPFTVKYINNKRYEFWTLINLLLIYLFIIRDNI